jgi:serine/threonine protein kinase
MQAGFKLSGRYALQALLGHGGMGEVWRGVDEQLDRPVAVKVLRERFADPELAVRFRREARIAARLQHPGITVVHDVGSDNGQLFIVMELLHGRDLAAMLAEAPAGLPVDAAVSLTCQAAEALQAAHAGHVVHRDLKPANLFVLDGGQLKICDFGIAWAVDSTTHLTATGQVIGTPAYMSPEQCRGEQVDERSDLYSLGCVLYALLTGRPPFAEGQPMAIMLQHLNATPAPPRAIRPDVPPVLDHLVLELLAKDSTRRPADAGQVIAALRALRYTPTVKVKPTAKASSRLDPTLKDAEPKARGKAEQSADLARQRSAEIARLAEQQQKYGPEHRETLHTRHGIAWLTGQLGDAAGARDEFAALLPAWEREFGKDSPNTRQVRYHLASSTGQAGDPAGARDQFAALLEICERVSGPRNEMETRNARKALAYWTEKSGILPNSGSAKRWRLHR